MKNPQFLLVEPVAKTPFPPLGLLKISTMLQKKHRDCAIFTQVGNDHPDGLRRPEEIYITSLFTWDLDSVTKTINYHRDRFPRSKIHVGGIAASVMPNHIKAATGITPHIGLLEEAEGCLPDYSINFGRRIGASITFTSRGCPRNCRFCSVKVHEPSFFVRNNWEMDIEPSLSRIVFWDNNWLASPNVIVDCQKIKQLGKVVDFNQGLDARLYTQEVAEALATIDIDPVRFAFDDVRSEKSIVDAIRLAKSRSRREISVYVLYNFEDTPEQFYYRVNLLNKEGVLSFPMEYRKPTASKVKFPGPHWDSRLLRALKLSLLFYYRKGMITESRKSFLSIYGESPHAFIEKLYSIYEYDKRLKRNR